MFVMIYEKYITNMVCYPPHFPTEEKMKQKNLSIQCLVLISLTILAWILTLSSPLFAADRVALVIGNGSYQHATRLDNPVNDADDMARALTSLGFKVIKKTDTRFSTLKKTIKTFGRRLNKAEMGFFYYAGHGIQINGTNYLVPVDAACESPADVEFEAVKADWVLARMQQAGSKLNIVILDACRDNPFRSFRSGEKGLAPIHAPKGTIVAFATAPGAKAEDGTGRNGTYTAHLLKNIQNSNLTVQDIFRETGLAVMADTDERQIPWTSSTPVPRFYLAAGTTIVAGSHAPGTSRPALGTLQVLSRPSGAWISVNNVDKGNAPVVITELSPGSYKISGRLSGYQSLEKQVQVNPGRKAMLTLYLDPVKTAARLYVTPTPSAATVRIMNIPDKYHSGIELTPGRYQVEVSHPGHETHSRWIEITGTDDIDLYVELSPESAQQRVEMGQSTHSTVSTSASGSRRSGEKWKEPVTGMEFVWVPKGCYQMGCGSWAGNCNGDEKPVHEVCLDGFWMGKTEVTQGQWQRIMGSNPSNFKNVSNDPVEMVSWNDTQTFIQKLSSRSGKRFSLPTEAQWEYAARSGGKAELYSGDSNLDRVAWHSGNSGGKTHPVASKSANGLGIYDMTGNVWEWCQDVYDKNAYGKYARNNPVSTSGSTYRVLRGGSWINYPGGCRVANRSRIDPSGRLSNYGFRLVLLSGQ